MKLRFFAILLSAALAPLSLVAQTEPAVADTSAPAAPDKGQIEVLLAPVALYPDALVALILPAATHPSEIVLASRFLQSEGADEDIDAQPWDDSVKALAHYPEVVQFMDENLAWTQDVGDAFVAYPADVMSSIQTLRARAARNGLLADTPQQKVVFEDDDVIRIVPAEPEVIYVPYYEPSYLYYTDSYVYYPSSLMWFGVGYGIGSWLSYDCSWSHRTIWVTNHTHWDRGYDWRRRYDRNVTWHVGGSNWDCWRPSTSHRFSRPRGDFNYAHATRNYTGWNRDGDSRRDGHRDWTRNRDDNNRDNNGAWTRHPRSTTTVTTADKSVNRPDNIRNPSATDRGDRSGTRFDRHDGDNTRSFNHDRENPPIETTQTTTTDTTTPQDRRRSLAPIHRAPDLVDRRNSSFDRRNNTPRPATPPSSPREITSGADIRHPRSSPPPAPAQAPTMRREAPRQTVSAPPPRSPAPTRTITSGADIRQPRTYSPPPAPAPRMQSAPPVSRSESSRSSPPPQDASSTRHGRSDTRKN